MRIQAQSAADLEFTWYPADILKFSVDIEHIKSLAGIEHIDIGTDVNGLRDPTVISTHREFVLIPAGLLARGYAEADVRKIIGGDFLRVFREVAG